jgi:hypothetical protein
MSDFMDSVRRLLASMEREQDQEEAALGPRTPVGPLAPPSCAALSTMLELNPNAFVALENDELVAIEDCWDCAEDGRMFRLEYHSTLDGSRAVAFCRSNPWNRQDVQAGQGVVQCHVFDDGLLCLGHDHARTARQSPRNLRDTVLRARFWCTGFSVLMETGEFPNL